MGDKVAYTKDEHHGGETLTVKWCGRYDELPGNRDGFYDGKLVVTYNECAGFDWCTELRLVTPLEELL